MVLCNQCINCHGRGVCLAEKLILFMIHLFSLLLFVVDVARAMRCDCLCMLVKLMRFKLMCLFVLPELDSCCYRMDLFSECVMVM